MNILSGFLIIVLFCGYSALLKVKLNTTRQLKYVKNSGRIVGGTVASEGSHHHMVALIRGRVISHRFCGGSLVGIKHILTAAHCVAGRRLESIRALVGTNRWNMGGQMYNISYVAIHEGYTEFIIKNDIAILYTYDEVQYNEFVKPISLNYDLIRRGTPALFAGWGTGNKLKGSQDHLEMSSKIVDDQHCVDIVSLSEPLAPPVWPDIEICAFQSFGIGICHADSGSALMDNKTNQQIGIASWIIHCARGAPDVYVRISAYRDWINPRLIDKVWL